MKLTAICASGTLRNGVATPVIQQRLNVDCRTQTDAINACKVGMGRLARCRMRWKTETTGALTDRRYRYAPV